MCFILCTNLRSNCLLADIFKFDSNHIENKESTKAIKAEILGAYSSDMSQDQRRATARTTKKVRLRIHSLPRCLNMLQPSLRKRVLKTVRRRISLICAG